MWHHALTGAPLAAGDERYVALHDAGRGAIDEIEAAIELNYDTTTQLLSGPSGAGKTTELLRLQHELQQDGYRVALLNATDYISESEPISVTEFLIALGLGAHAALGSAEPDTPGFGARLYKLLERLQVRTEVGPLAVTASSDSVGVGAFGASLEVGLKRELPSSKEVVDELRAKLGPHIGQLRSEVASFILDLVRDAESEENSHGVVFLVDSLDKLRGTTEDDQNVQQSVQRLFVHHADRLRFESHHAVYTVPTYLQLIAPGTLPYDSRRHIVPVPSLVGRNGKSDSATERTMDELHQVVARRLPVERVFATREQLTRLIHASGGNLRDLFFILRQLMNLLLRLSAPLPATDEHIDEAIRDVAHDFANLTSEQEDFLKRVAASDGTIWPEEAEVGLMTLLLQNHLLLAHLNGAGNWYEVHPLARRALGLA